MTNRERYITKSNEYDIMMTIANSAICPIAVITDKVPVEWKECSNNSNYIESQEKHYYGWQTSLCSSCIQSWLNKESEK